jgi:sporulation protein YlmC with PRC-barrel domain
MIRTLLATTAIAAVLALPVVAQEAASSSMEAPMASSSMEAPMASSSMEAPMAPSSAMMPAASFDISTGYSVVDTDRLASHIMGKPVYDGPAGDANNLGNVNDLVLDANGNVVAVVIGVGGFLGIGEKQVAVPFSALQQVVAEDQTERLVVATTAEQLTAAPDFVTVDDQPASGAAPMTPAPADVPPSSAPAM